MVGPWGGPASLCQTGADLHRPVPGALGVGRGSVRLAEPGAEAGQVGQLPGKGEEVEPGTVGESLCMSKSTEAHDKRHDT